MNDQYYIPYKRALHKTQVIFYYQRINIVNNKNDDDENQISLVSSKCESSNRRTAFTCSCPGKFKEYTRLQVEYTKP